VTARGCSESGCCGDSFRVRDSCGASQLLVSKKRVEERRIASEDGVLGGLRE
jgi:hypothetical protein